MSQRLSTFVISLFAISFFATGALHAQSPEPLPQQPPAASPQQPPAAVPQAPAPQPSPMVAMGTLNLRDGSLSALVDELAKLLRMNIVYDTPLKGGVTINTYGDTRNLSARDLLDQVLRINGFCIAQQGETYHVFGIKDISHQPIRIERATEPGKIPEDDQLMLNLVFLNYITVEGMVGILQEFAGDGAQIKSYPAANLLFIEDSRHNMRRLMELIGTFDSDTFANGR